jgi:hypothetical protein
MRLLYGWLMAASVAGCAMNPAPVPVVGDSWGILDLAGEWTGEYQGRDTDRSGSIVFRLDAGHDTAFGDVVMSPGLTLGSRNNPQAYPVNPARDAARTLFIRFVRVEGNQVTGIMEPYRSPDCGCLLSTAFTGVRRGNRIQGTYVTQHRECEMPPEHGTWWVER